MKRYYTFFIAFLFCFTGYSQVPGTLDATFGTGGKVVTSINSGQDKAYDVVIQPDGKIVIAGYTQTTITGKDFAVLRYNIDGSPDVSFGTNGIVTTDLQLGSDDVAFSLTLDANNKIIVAGYSDDGSNKNAAIVRYKTNGIIDSTFGINGIVITNFESNYQDEIHVVQYHPLTGKIIVGGAAIISSTLAKPVVARYLPNGRIDSTFNSTGIKTLWVTTLDYQYNFMLEDLKVQSNGKISAVGWRDFPSLSWDSDMWACRINNDGTMDVTFSTDGVNVYNGAYNGHDRFSSMFLLPSGNIIGAGGSYVSTLSYDFKALEISTSGATTGWSATVSTNAGDDYINALATDFNGYYVVAGYGGTSTNSSFVVGRILTTGVFDNSFNTGGYVTTTFNGNLVNVANGVAVHIDDKIVAVGFSGNDIALARYIGYNTVGINSTKETSNSISVYPNPSSGIITINIDKINEQMSDRKIEIYNAIGEKVYIAKLEQQTSIEVDLSNFYKGIYFVKLDNGTEIYNTKIIVQ